MGIFNKMPAWQLMDQSVYISCTIALLWAFSNNNNNCCIYILSTTSSESLVDYQSVKMRVKKMGF